MNKYEIFKLISKSVVIYTILCLICTFAAFVLCYFCITVPNNVWLTFFKDVSVIVATTFAVSLLIGLLVEKNSKEDFYLEITKYTINSKTFSKRLFDEEKTKLCKDLNKNFRCNNNAALYSIYSDFEKRFVEQDFMKKKYYLEECRYDINCRVLDNYIEKECTKTMYFKSYLDKCDIPELILGTHSNKFFGDCKSFELKSLTIDGNTLTKKELERQVKEEHKLPDDVGGPLLGARNEYNQQTTCKYKKKIKLNSTKAVAVSYKYITRTDISDNALTVRCNRPCKKFSVNFKIENKNYEIKAIAFGFIDKAGDSPNTSNKQSISVEFRKWILPEDGVVVLINKL